MKDGKIRILWCSDGGIATGFARVAHSIINNLPETKYDIHHLAINYRGDPYPEAKAPLYPAMLGGDLYGFGRIENMLESLKPDLVFILNDAWVIKEYLKKIPEEQKIVTYFPVDAKPLQKDWCKALVERSTLVAYTQFGRSAITDHFEDADVQIIPHGVDTEKFFPMDMQEARKKMAGLADDDFIILNANRNQPRKRFDLTLKGFALFAKDKPDNVKIYCHCGVEDAGYNLIVLARRYGIEARLVLTALDIGPANFVSDERLNWIYNAADIGLNNGGGEGWGLPNFEHAACKRAQIVPNSSACAELYGGRAYCLPIDHYSTYVGILTEGAVTSPEAIAKGMEFYYTHPEQRETDAQNLYTFVTDPRFDWKNIAIQWDQLFEKVVTE